MIHYSRFFQLNCCKCIRTQQTKYVVCVTLLLKQTVMYSSSSVNITARECRLNLEYHSRLYFSALLSFISQDLEPISRTDCSSYIVPVVYFYIGIFLFLCSENASL